MSLLFGRAPRGFREPKRYVSDVHPNDLRGIRVQLRGGQQLEVHAARVRKDGTIPPTFVFYRIIGCCNRRTRVGAVTLKSLRALALEFGWCRAWDVMSEKIVICRGVWERAARSLPASTQGGRPWERQSRWRPIMDERHSAKRGQP